MNVASTTSTGWTPQPEGLHRLLELLRNVPNPSFQQQIKQDFENLKQHPEWGNYLLFVMTNCTTEPEHVRQVAGLLLKNYLWTNTNVPHLIQAVKENILVALKDPKWSVVCSAASIISAVIRKEGLAAWNTLLPCLYQQLSSTDNTFLSSILYTLAILCEDYSVEMDKPEIGQPASYLIPKFIELFKHPEEKVRHLALRCISEFLPSMPSSMTTNLPPFLPALFALATDQAPKIRQKVCRAIVTITEQHVSILAPHMADIVRYMLYSTQDANLSVAVEACEFWQAIASSRMCIDSLKEFLPTLLPVLLNKMVYTEADITQIEAEDDNSQTPDKPQDIKPRFRHTKGTLIDEGDEDGATDDYGEPSDWTIRKCSAAGLDTLSNVFKDDLLPPLLPLIQQTLSPQMTWQVIESGILAIGAIAEGCLNGLSPHLPILLPFLLNFMSHPQPLIRSISCWTLSRYSRWIVVDAQKVGHDKHLRPLMGGLLQCIHDTSKRVQEAACSAFATLEEEAQVELVVYLKPIVENLMQAFKKYQAKNLMILYDAIGTLADAVGSELNTDEYKSLLLGPLFEKWNALGDSDKALFPLLECLTSVAVALGQGFQNFALPVFRRCLQIIESVLLLFVVAQTDSHKDYPDTELIVCSLDLLGGLFEGLQQNIAPLCTNSNIVPLVFQCLKLRAADVRQSATAIVGDLAKYVYGMLEPGLPEILPLLAENLNPQYINVCNNTSWAIGEIALKYQGNMRPFVPSIIPRLIPIICRSRLNKIMRENVAICMCRIAQVAPDLVATQITDFLPFLCLVLRAMREDAEKESAYTGLYLLVSTNPKGSLQYLVYVCDAFCAHRPQNNKLLLQYGQLLHFLKAQMTPQDWETAKSAFPPQLSQVLGEIFDLR
ncbi:importin beta-2 [Pelomyxa schiedti]|nr:importin beta-2 [Pelomyxa schiedti]